MHPPDLEEEDIDETNTTESQPQVPSHLGGRRSAGRLSKVVCSVVVKWGPRLWEKVIQNATVYMHCYTMCTIGQGGPPAIQHSIKMRSAMLADNQCMPSLVCKHLLIAILPCVLVALLSN